VKLATVISDIFGVSGRNLLSRLLEQGYIDEDDIEHRVKGQVKKKVTAIADSLFGTIDDHQMFMIRQSWDHIVYLEKSLRKLDEKIDSYLEKYKTEVELLQTMPGVSKVTAACIIAEIGTDMNQFPTSDHLCSWAGVAPGNHESAGKKKYNYSQRQPPYKDGAM
jgi:transposase